MEGAAGAVVGAGFPERDIALNDVDNVDAGQEFLDKAFWDHGEIMPSKSIAGPSQN